MIMLLYISQCVFLYAQDLQPLAAGKLDDEVTDLAVRPAMPPNRMGRPVTLYCNHFPFQLKKATIYQYVVEFTVSYA